MIVIGIERLAHSKDLPLPQYMTAHSSGADLHAALTESVTIAPLGRCLIPTGFCFEIPPGYEIQIRPRSGLAVKHGITVLNTPGTIDADYRGEVQVLLINLGDTDFIVHRGERIAQAIVAPVEIAQFTEQASLPETERGANGFGHTGKN